MVIAEINALKPSADEGGLMDPLYNISIWHAKAIDTLFLCFMQVDEATMEVMQSETRIIFMFMYTWHLRTWLMGFYVNGMMNGKF